MFIVILTGQEYFKAIHAHLDKRHEHSDAYFSPTEISLKSDGGSPGTQQFCEVPNHLTFLPPSLLWRLIFALFLTTDLRMAATAPAITPEYKRKSTA